MINTQPVSDLAEHIGTILWIAGGLLFLVGVLVTLIWNDQRKNIAEAMRKGSEFSEWLKKLGETEGGIVTRKDYYEWCGNQQAKCPASVAFKALNDWRNTMLEKGGILGRTEHLALDEKNLAICKEMVRELGNQFSEKLEQMLRYHREWVAQELKVLSTETNSVFKLLKRRIEVDDLRWTNHDDTVDQETGGKK